MRGSDEVVHPPPSLADSALFCKLPLYHNNVVKQALFSFTGAGKSFNLTGDRSIFLYERILSTCQVGILLWKHWSEWFGAFLT